MYTICYLQSLFEAQMQCHFEFQRRAVLASRLSAGRGKSGFYGARASCALVLEIKSAGALMTENFISIDSFDSMSTSYPHSRTCLTCFQATGKVNSEQSAYTLGRKQLWLMLSFLLKLQYMSLHFYFCRSWPKREDTSTVVVGRCIFYIWCKTPCRKNVAIFGSQIWFQIARAKQKGTEAFDGIFREKPFVSPLNLDWNELFGVGSPLCRHPTSIAGPVATNCENLRPSSSPHFFF